MSPLLSDIERILGPSHPGTCTTRNNIARWTGQRGDYERVLGPGDSETLAIRDNIAHGAQMLAEKAASTTLVSEGDGEQAP